MKKTTLMKAVKFLEQCAKDSDLSFDFGSLKSFVKNMSEAASNQQQGFPLPKEGGAVYVFSDGGCRGNPGPGAWAYCVQTKADAIDKSETGFTASTTNNVMELSGAIFGLKSLLKERPAKIILYSDSQYVVKGVNEWIPSWKRRGWRKSNNQAPENLELWKELDKLNSELNVEFKWVKGHSGHPQNELCDELLNQRLDQELA